MEKGEFVTVPKEVVPFAKNVTLVTGLLPFVTAAMICTLAGAIKVVPFVGLLIPRLGGEATTAVECVYAQSVLCCDQLVIVAER